MPLVRDKNGRIQLPKNYEPGGREEYSGFSIQLARKERTHVNLSDVVIREIIPCNKRAR